MSSSYGPKIPTNGLILHLDAGNKKSYGESGTIWRDLSKYKNNFSLVGSPIFSSGNFSFPTNSQYSFSNSFNFTLLPATFCVWAKRNSNLPPYSAIFNARYSSGHGLLTHGVNTNNLSYMWNNNGWAWDSGYTLPLDQWIFITLTVTSTGASYYINGNFVSSNSQVNSSATFSQFYIAKDFQFVSRVFIGSIGTVLTYDRLLTTSEIKQLFHSTRSRFNV